MAVEFERLSRMRHGAFGLIALMTGASVYLLVRDPVPLLGTAPVLGANSSWWLGSLPSAFHGAALVFGASWAIRGAARTQLVVLPLFGLGFIESSQALGPFSGWGTFDPMDLVFGLAASVAVAGWLGRARSPSVVWSSHRTRLVIVSLVAVVSATATSFPWTTDIEVTLGEPTLVQVDADTTIFEVTAVVADGPADELVFEGFANRRRDAVSVSMGSCGAFNTSSAGCKFTVIRTDPAVDSVMVRVGVRAGVLNQSQAIDFRMVLVTFDTSTTGDVNAPAAVEEGSGPAPICGEVGPQERTYPLEVGRLIDELLVQTYSDSDYTRSGRTVVLTGDGSGVLQVGLLIDGREHDPCVDGRIDSLTYRLEVSGREGDRGNVAIRPALFVGDSAYVAIPLTIAKGAGVSEVLELTPADFTRLQGNEMFDPVSGPPVRFGFVVGISCPESSNCGAVERGVTVNMLEVIVDEGAAAP